MKQILKAWWPSILTAGVVLWLTLAAHPLPEMGDMPPIPNLDKLVHFIMFGGLTGAIIFDAKRLKKDKRRHLSPTFYVILALSMLVFAYGDECLQEAMGHGRTYDIMDFMADSTGIAIALATAPRVVNWLLRTWHRRQPYAGRRHGDRGNV